MGDYDRIFDGAFKGLAFAVCLALAGTLTVGACIGYAAHLKRAEGQAKLVVSKSMMTPGAMYGVVLRPDGVVTIWCAAPGPEKGFTTHEIRDGETLSIGNGSKTTLVVNRRTE